VTTDLVTAFFRVYRNSTAGERPTVTAQIIGSDGRVVHEATLELEGTGYQFDLPLEALLPGEYLFQVRASAGDERASREIRFRIE